MTWPATSWSRSLPAVLDVGDDVAHAGVWVITGEQVVDLGDDLVLGHHFGIADGASARLRDGFERNPEPGLSELVTCS